MNIQPTFRFGVFRHGGHVAIAYPSAAAADSAAQALSNVGVSGALARRCSNRAMRARLDHDLEPGNPRAARGSQRRRLEALRAFAARGCHWLLVHADDDLQAAVVAACVPRPASFAGLGTVTP